MLTQIFLSNGFPDDSPAVKSAVTAEQAAEAVVRGVEAEKFLILTHPGPERGLAEKSADYDAWLGSMAPNYGPIQNQSTRKEPGQSAQGAKS
jgi:hypothetical protein